MEPLRVGVRVDAPPARAFEVFTERMGEWWPKEFSWSQDLVEEMGIEPRPGGFAYEPAARLPRSVRLSVLA